MANEVLYEIEGEIVVITLNRPEKRNALNAAMREGLWEAWRNFESDPRLRVAILTGAGDKAFCAGIDLIEFTETRLGVPPPNFLPVIGQNIRSASRSSRRSTAVLMRADGGWRRCAIYASPAKRARFAITEARVGRGVPWAAPLIHMIPQRVHARVADDRQPDLGATGL